MSGGVKILRARFYESSEMYVCMYWRNSSSVNERGRKTNTNYVDSDTESGQSSTPNYVFSVGDRLGQRSEIVTVAVGGVHLPNVLIDSGATCSLLGQVTWEWLKSQKIQWPKHYFLMEIQSHCQHSEHLQQTLCPLTLVRPAKLTL